MRFLILNGPNLNLLGIREPDIYGHKDYNELVQFLQKCCSQEGIACEIIQSNHEGILIDEIQKAIDSYDGIIINAAAYSHTSIAILDALNAVKLPAVEVHLSDISTREAFRTVSLLSKACITTFMGKGFESYREAIIYLKQYITD